MKAHLFVLCSSLTHDLAMPCALFEALIVRLLFSVMRQAEAEVLCQMEKPVGIYESQGPFLEEWAGGKSEVYCAS